MKIKLNLSNHCIETETKRLYNQFVSEYFKDGSDNKHLEKQIEIFKTILERCDFPSLRSRYPELAGNYTSEVTLSIYKQNRIVIHINGKEIYLF